MRPVDKPIFAAAARQFDVWILVRRTNPASLKYVGLPNFMPKRIDCKAKTADRDVGRYRLAGLVVDPTVQPQAFSAGRMVSAEHCWRQFAAEQGLAAGPVRGSYAVDDDPQSPHCGCVTFEGRYIHGDYDLYDIVLAEHPRGNLAAVETLHGQPHRRGARVIPVMQYINNRIGVPMVQHGGEAQFKGHSEQSIDVFGPHGEECTILNEYSVRGWYETTFRGRQTLG